MKELIKKYEKLVLSNSIDEHDNKCLDKVQKMIREMLTWDDEKIHSDKAHRWLGFIQGLLWRAGLQTVEQMRSDVKRMKSKILEKYK